MVIYPLSKHISAVRAMIYVVAIGLIALTLGSCASDNVHQPRPPEVAQDVYFKGDLASYIPAFPLFGPAMSANDLAVVWANYNRNRASLILSEFSLFIEEMQFGFTIGQMKIDGVTFTYDDNGNATIEQEAFTCMAGQYYTRGSLRGIYCPKEGTIEFTIEYHPGSMPFTVKSIYTSSARLETNPFENENTEDPN